MSVARMERQTPLDAVWNAVAKVSEGPAVGRIDYQDGHKGTGWLAVHVGDKVYRVEIREVQP